MSEEPDPRQAITAHRDQLAAEPRPERLTHTDLAADVHAAQAAASWYRVYRPEWVIVYTAHAATMDPRPLSEPTSPERHVELARAAIEYFEAHYLGRVRDGDVRLFLSGRGAHAVVLLQLRLANLTGVFKTEELALDFAADHAWTDTTIVARNSRLDHELRGYGVKKLPQR